MLTDCRLRAFCKLVTHANFSCGTLNSCSGLKGNLVLPRHHKIPLAYLCIRLSFWYGQLDMIYAVNPRNQLGEFPFLGAPPRVSTHTFACASAVILRYRGITVPQNTFATRVNPTSAFPAGLCKQMSPACCSLIKYQNLIRYQGSLAPLEQQAWIMFVQCAILPHAERRSKSSNTALPFYHHSCHQPS